MTKETSLVKKQLGLAWKGGNTLIKYCEDPAALRKILSEGLFGAINLYSNETREESVKIMVADMLTDYEYEDVSLILEVIQDIRKGKRKIYGKVTPFDLREMITAKLQEQAINRERKHQDQKGFTDYEIGDRRSGRISDLLNENIK